MYFLYNLLIHISNFFLSIAAFFNRKLKIFVDGRTHVFSDLKKTIHKNDKTIWFHCASLGEFEQGLPIMEALKIKYPLYKLVLTFFSPSGYEVKKDVAIADIVVYLPLDTAQNAKKFIQFVHPSLVVFIKYEFWPNYLFELKKNDIPTILVSGLFRANQSFFTWYGGFMRKSLKTFHHFFVQNEISKTLLENISINAITVSGDTRFDRVSQQVKMNNDVPFIESFKQDKLCLVFGSTWPEDEDVLLDFINLASDELKIIIAPHKVDATKISLFRKKLTRKSVLYSEKEQKEISPFSILLIDNVGLLSKIYSYADIAYVGGAIGHTGLHNILEPAAFGMPIVTGNDLEKFPEAVDLAQLGGLFTIKNSVECSQILKQLIKEKAFREVASNISEKFVANNTGATASVMKYINSLNF